MDKQNRIVAAGLLSQRNLKLLSPDFHLAFPLGADDDEFTRLLDAIDEAESRVMSETAEREP